MARCSGTLEVEAGGRRPTQLHSEFTASLGYMRPRLQVSNKDCVFHQWNCEDMYTDFPTPP